MEEILSVRDLKRVYGRGTAATQALGGVSLSVEQGEFVGIMGPSGSGKTTLLNCIATIDRPTSGSIRVGGQELTGLRGRALTRFRRERLGFIFQDCNLLDTLTAFENIALALAITRAPAKEIEGRVREMSQRLGIEDCLDKYLYAGNVPRLIAGADDDVIHREVHGPGQLDEGVDGHLRRADL